MDPSDGKYRKSFRVPMSMCDAGGRLSPVQVAAIFQDAATEDAERRGIGLSAMREKRFYWLTARAKYRFLALPRVMAALLENNQTPNGIIVPEVLRPFTGFDLIN